MRGAKKTAPPGRPYFRLATALLAAYLIAAALFYWLAGDQLHLRRSRGGIPMPVSESVTLELTAGTVVEQRFTAEIQCLEEVGVLWGTFYRPNVGTVQMELYHADTGALLAERQFDMAEITECGVTVLTFDPPLEGFYNAPLLLRLTSPDAQPGAAVTPLMNLQEPPEDSALLLNGEPASGVLCFAADGVDRIWTGLHYRELTATGFFALVLYLAAVWERCRNGRPSRLMNAVEAVRKYRFLIRQLVARDFKTKYKRSVLGVLWSFLNPLLTMCVQYFVFSTIFKNDIENFAVYLLIGVVCFNFFTESCGMALTSILSNANLITKVYMPKYIYPLTRVMSSVVNLGISLLPLAAVALLTGTPFRKSVLLSAWFFACLIVFSLGLGMLLSAAMVFFRDTQFLWGVLSMVWMYATPIFYPETILPENFRFVLRINPLYYFLQDIRMCILYGRSPEPFAYFQCLLIALGMLLLGAWIFRKSQDRFVLYL